jgi:DNA-binding beta-propeller fold protein YncE
LDEEEGDGLVVITSKQSIIARKSLRSFLGTLLVVVGVLLAFSGSAFGARPHEFSKAIKPEGANALKEPAGVAVNETSGDVYVVDKGNNRVENFSSSGTYIGQFNGTEIDGVAAGAGKEAPAKFSEPTAIAVDNSCIGGALECSDPSVTDVYVVDAGHKVIDKFSATGEYLGQLAEAGTVAFGPLGSVAVDPKGELWVCQSKGTNDVGVDNFSNADTNQFLSSRDVMFSGPVGTPLCAVNAQGDLYVGGTGVRIAEFDSKGAVLNPAVDEEPASGIAIEFSTDDVYIDNISALNRFTPNGSLLERLAVPDLHGGGVAVNSSSGQIYVADSSSDVVDLYVFEPPPKPSVESESVSDITEHDATLRATINTHDVYTGYWFQIDTNSSYNFTQADCPFKFPGRVECESITDGEPLPAGLVEPHPEYIPAGAGIQTVSLDLANIGASLQPGTSYHYRVIASSGEGIVEGADQTFLTPNSAEEEAWFKKFAEENAKKVAEEAAAREAAAKQETATAAAKKHEEETAAAASKKHEEEVAKNPPVVKAVTPKRLTKAQKLAKALRACKKESKRKQAGCEKLAHKKYGTAGKKASKKGKRK